MLVQANSWPLTSAALYPQYVSTISILFLTVNAMPPAQYVACVNRGIIPKQIVPQLQFGSPRKEEYSTVHDENNCPSERSLLISEASSLSVILYPRNNGLPHPPTIHHAEEIANLSGCMWVMVGVAATATAAPLVLVCWRWK